MSDSDHSFSPDKPGPSAETPPSIPGHQLLRQIAHGSYGEIWLARTELGAFRAVKIIRRANFSDARPYDREFAGIQRYEPVSREHEGLVDVLQVGREEASGFFYYVMELADDAAGSAGNPKSEVRGAKADCAAGPPRANRPLAIGNCQSYIPLTLAHLIRHRQRLSVSEVIELGIGLAQALDFLHSRRLVHRDIKPQNIIFVGGQPKLADVGLIAALGSPQSFVGTEGYIPPEGPGSAQADIYSLGKVLYEAATGKDREEFPDLPTGLGEGPDDLALAELNEVFLKACESNPRVRYACARQMAEDLQRLKAGQSLRARRARGRRLRALGVVAVAAGLVVLALGVATAKRAIEERWVVEIGEEFDGHELDTNRWAWGHADFGDTNTGRRLFQVEPTGSNVALRAETESRNGQTVSEVGWLDLLPDLQRVGHCRVDIELSGRARGGMMAIVISDRHAPTSDADSTGERLTEFNASQAHMLNRTSAWASARIRIQTLPTCRAALVWPDARREDEFIPVNLSDLSAWHLRFWCRTFTAAQRPPGFLEFKLDRVRVSCTEKPEPLVGWAFEEISGWPIPAAAVSDRNGTPLGTTLTNGAFSIFRSLPGGRLALKKPGYEEFSDRVLREGEQAALVRLRLRKLVHGFGEVVEIFPVGAPEHVTSIGIWKDELLLARARSESACEFFRVASNAVQSADADAVAFFPRKMVAFAECQGRLIGISQWQGVVWDLTPGRTNQVSRLMHKDGSPVNWPTGCACNGQWLWFVENDGPKQQYALHSFDLDRKVIVRTLKSNDARILGLAWDGKQFWISSGEGKVYAVERGRAEAGGSVEAGRTGKEFKGAYDRLAFSQGYLWGLELGLRRICKIKVME